MAERQLCENTDLEIDRKKAMQALLRRVAEKNRWYAAALLGVFEARQWYGHVEASSKVNFILVFESKIVCGDNPRVRGKIRKSQESAFCHDRIDF